MRRLTRVLDRKAREKERTRANLAPGVRHSQACRRQEQRDCEPETTRYKTWGQVGRWHNKSRDFGNPGEIPISDYGFDCDADFVSETCFPSGWRRCSLLSPSYPSSFLESRGGRHWLWLDTMPGIKTSMERPRMLLIDARWPQLGTQRDHRLLQQKFAETLNLCMPIITNVSSVGPVYICGTLPLHLKLQL